MIPGIDTGGGGFQGSSSAGLSDQSSFDQTFKFGANRGINFGGARSNIAGGGAVALAVGGALLFAVVAYRAGKKRKG